MRERVYSFYLRFKYYENSFRSSIDVVIFEEVIEHLYNSDLVMSEIKRVLNRDGILILSNQILHHG
ncbi:methyltransferase domain-containing protein [Saccharolobus islandicus]|uniref:methyltransferase domain-containing protein n=1 Tax=Saccharolobus islandicus TaxID=43080 RepID=UPI0030B8E8DB